MDTKQAKKVLNKNIKVAQKKGAAIKKDAIKKYAVAKKDAIEKGGELEKMAMKELAKIQKQMDATSKKTAEYIKRHPGKAALISAGIGAALGTAAALLISQSGKKPSKSKK